MESKNVKNNAKINVHVVNNAHANAIKSNKKRSNQKRKYSARNVNKIKQCWFIKINKFASNA